MKDISEAAAPAKIERKLLEKDVQKQCVDWARARCYWVRMFSSMSQRSVPDFLFSRILPLTFLPLTYEDGISPMGNAKIKFNAKIKLACEFKFACEFKRPGTKLTKKMDDTMSMSTQAQHDEQVAMREAGWFVFECDNFDKFKATVLAYEAEQV